jgi:hypothetical protein
LNAEQVVGVAQDMLINYGFSSEELESSFDNLVRRQILGRNCVQSILPLLKASGVVPEPGSKDDYHLRPLFAPDFTPSIEPRPEAERIGDRIYALEGVHEPWVPEHIDYLSDLR